MPKVQCKSIYQDGHFKCGLKWSYDGETNYAAEVTDEQLQELQDDRRLHVKVLSETDTLPPKSDAKKKPLITYM